MSFQWPILINNTYYCETIINCGVLGFMDFMIHLNSLTPIFVVSTKCIDPRVLEFVVPNTAGNSQWENGILLRVSFT
jgi:hypothetical protein